MRLMHVPDKSANTVKIRQTKVSILRHGLMSPVELSYLHVSHFEGLYLSSLCGASHSKTCACAEAGSSELLYCCYKILGTVDLYSLNT